MDVVRLNKTSYTPEKLIEGYQSMIWTERYSPCGEFEMTTSLVEQTRSLLPLSSLISLRDSKQVMIVESHRIDIDEDGTPTLKILGRSFESFFENRQFMILEFTSSTGPNTIHHSDQNASSGAGMAAGAINVACSPYSFPAPQVPEDVIPSYTAWVETGFVSIAPTGFYDIPPKNLYDMVVEHLTLDKAGIKTVRPPYSTPSGPPYDDGLNTIIYRGKDRTIQQSTNPHVVFDVAKGDFEPSSYLFSIRGFKNAAYSVIKAQGSDGSVTFDPNSDFWRQIVGIPESPAGTGLDRRVASVNTDLASWPFDGNTAQRAQNLGAQELRNSPTINLVDGKVSPLALKKYGVDYFLGDLVTVRAGYGINNNFRVTEYIRVEDEDGERGYPTLAIQA